MMEGLYGPVPQPVLDLLAKGRCDVEEARRVVEGAYPGGSPLTGLWAALSCRMQECHVAQCGTPVIGNDPGPHGV